MSAPKKSIPRPGRKPAPETTQSSATPHVSTAPAGSQQIALLAARAGLEKKATGVEIIDVTGKVDYADYLVLMTGASDRNVAAIAQEVDGALAKAGFRSMSVEGLPSAQWVLIDFVDVVVHVFQKDVRSLYDLDGLWMDAERVPMQDARQSRQVPVASQEEDADAAPSPGALPVRSRSKASKRPTKKAKTAGSKTTGRRAGSATGSRAGSSSGKTTARGRSSAGVRTATGGSRAGTKRAAPATSTARASSRSAAATKPARKSKAGK